jgi:hypothetical protein
VTTEILRRMKEFGQAEYGLVYDPPGGALGTATRQTPLGECVIEFVHDEANTELTVTLVKKPWLLPKRLIWWGFSAAVDRCS